MPAIDLKTIPRPVKTYHTTPPLRIAPANAGFDGTGKTVVVTGGASGIGEAIAHAFCETGIKRLVIISRSADDHTKAMERLAKSFPSIAMISHLTSVTEHEKIKTILNELATVDVLVLSHTASNDQNIPIMTVPLAEIQACYDVNVVANWNLVHTFLSLSPPNHRRTVINVASAAAQFTAPGGSGYGPSKAALIQMMSYFALAQKMGQLKGDNAFFSIHPGAIRTQGTEKFNVPMDAVTEWEDIKNPAHFSLWLASSEASFLTGRFVWATWDVDELIALKPQLEHNPFLLTLSLIQ